MHRRLTGATMVAASVALAVAALAAGFSTQLPAWWNAAVHLAILGGITLMIYAVNIRLVPVFSRRQWRSPRLLVAQVVAGGAGAWVAFFGEGLRQEVLIRAGHLLALVGGVLFMTNVMRLFRQSAVIPSPPGAGDTVQPGVDRIATRFTSFSGMLLVLGLAIGSMLTWWRPDGGRWDLVWAHTMLVGFFLTMAAGVCYHVLPRWTGQPWRSVVTIRWHLRLVMISLPLMLVAMAANSDWLFLVAGPLQAAALALFLVAIVPQAWWLGGLPRAGILVAAAFLIVGVGMGVSFAIDPALGARLRQAHAVANLFGWGGLLISGFGYRFVPAFAGSRLRWPRLARFQLATMLIGALAGVGAMAWRSLGVGPDVAVVVAQAIIAAGLLLFAVQVAGTFALPPGTTSVVVPLRRLSRGERRAVGPGAMSGARADVALPEHAFFPPLHPDPGRRVG